MIAFHDPTCYLSVNYWQVATTASIAVAASDSTEGYHDQPAETLPPPKDSATQDTDEHPIAVLSAAHFDRQAGTVEPEPKRKNRIDQHDYG